MIGPVFQPMRSVCADLGSSALLFPYGSFFSSFEDAFEVVRSLRSQGFRAVVKITYPNYTI